MTSPDPKQTLSPIIPLSAPRYREVGEGPFGCVTVDPRDGSVIVRRFRSHRAAVASMMRGAPGSPAESDEGSVGFGPFDGPEAA